MVPKAFALYCMLGYRSEVQDPNVTGPVRRPVSNNDRKRIG